MHERASRGSGLSRSGRAEGQRRGWVTGNRREQRQCRTTSLQMGFGWVNKTTAPVPTCRATGIQQETRFTKHGATSYANRVGPVKFDPFVADACNCVCQDEREYSMTNGARISLRDARRTSPAG